MEKLEVKSMQGPFRPACHIDLDPGIGLICNRTDAADLDMCFIIYMPFSLSLSILTRLA